MNLKDLEDYLDHRRDDEAARKVTAARTTKEGKPVAMARMTRKPLDQEAQEHVEGSKDNG